MLLLLCDVEMVVPRATPPSLQIVYVNDNVYNMHVYGNVQCPATIGNHPVTTHAVRPDQFNLLLLGYCEVKIGSSNRKKSNQKD